MFRNSASTAELDLKLELIPPIDGCCSLSGREIVPKTDIIVFNQIKLAVCFYSNLMTLFKQYKKHPRCLDPPFGRASLHVKALSIDRITRNSLNDIILLQFHYWISNTFYMKNLNFKLGGINSQEESTCIQIKLAIAGQLNDLA